MRMPLCKLLILIVTLLPMCAAAGTVDDKLTELDGYLKNDGRYRAEKEERIAALKKKLKRSVGNEMKYRNSIALYNEYKSYQYDSAFVYARRAQQTAKRMGQKDYLIEADDAEMFCLLSAGLYKEAFDKLRTVSVSGVSPQYMKGHYTLVRDLYYSISDYNKAMPYRKEYIRLGNAYTDSLLQYIKPGSTEWLYAMGLRRMKENRYDESCAIFKRMIADKGLDLHLRAIASSCIGWMRIQTEKGKTASDSTLLYLADAAICDIKTSTTETTALRSLAEQLFKMGDLAHATLYVERALQDARFYSARQRMIEVGELLPIVENDRYNIVKGQNSVLIICVTIISLLIIIVLVVVFSLYKQKKRLLEARNTIKERNDKLELANARLKEADNIKNEYIGNSFYFSSEFIDKMEKLYTMIDRKIRARQFEDLQSGLKESMVKKERDNMFNMFDTTFLKIFPDFISQYNSLFPEAERRVPDKENTLSSEMRIFALIRLGITESERIARFLNYSVHTVNTYKTRVKNKSLVENDRFEPAIMAINSVMK